MSELGNANEFFSSVSINVMNKSRNLVTTILFFLCLTFILTWYIQYIWKRRYLYYHSWNIPGPLSFPFIGTAYLFLSHTSDIMENLIEVQKKFPDISRMWFGPKLYYTVARPEHIEKILTNSNALDKDYLYKFLSFVIGEGLITARGENWRKHRKVIRPAFSQRMLDNFQEIFTRKTEILVENLHKKVENKNLDLFKLLSNLTLDIICETAMGINMDIQDSNSEFGNNLDKIMEITTYRIFHIWHHLEFTWHWYPLSKEYDRVIKNFKEFTGTLVKKKMEAYQQKLKQKLLEVDTEQAPTKHEAILDLILENSNFTENELREEVDIFMIAGTDTTASALNCIFVLLGMYPDEQQKMLDEILDIMGPDRLPLPSDFPEMKYTERFIKESLRLFPVAAFFLRKVKEDIVVDDIVFPAGCSVYFGPVHIQRNPKYWTDPLKFDPDRFLPENVVKRHPCTFIPFSYGPRNCIGGQYAMVIMKTVLAMVLRKFKIFTQHKRIEDIKLKANIVLRLKDGPQVWVENR